MKKKDFFAEMRKIKKYYTEKARPTTLRQACVESINKWETIMALTLEYQPDDWDPKGYITCSSCGLCKFFDVDGGSSDECKMCVLDGCGDWSYWNTAAHSEYNQGFINAGYRLIKAIRIGYKKKTGEEL